MLADHEILCRARIALSDALRTLLKPEVMDAADFRISLGHANAAADALVELLQQPHRDEA